MSGRLSAALRNIDLRDSMRHLHQTSRERNCSSLGKAVAKVLRFAEGYLLSATWLAAFVISGHTTLLQAAQVCIKDDLKREVCAPKSVKKIVSLSPGSTELIYAAGAGKQVVAVDDHSDYPPAVAKVPRVGGFPNVSIEAIAAMKPDLVVAWAGGNSPKVTSKLESLGVRVFYIDPLSFPEIASVIRRLGRLFGTSAVADKEAKRFLARYQSIKKKYQFKKPVTVFYEIWNKPLMSISRNQIIGQVIELCGGQNIYADSKIRVPKVSMESLLGKNPEVIVSSSNLKDGKAIEERWSKWSDLQAVKQHHLITVPGNLISRPAPRALDAAESLCQQLESVRKESLARASKTPANTHKE
ncbi:MULTISPECIES: cobalamin-binding protein [unclassified Endozoicomonas]|uniref:cobalamin-binding protein n=1 Tax=unclassified Endozoicomonas TaxID=2644528 RepID=UPI003BB54743